MYLSHDDHVLKRFLTSPYDRVNIVRSGMPAKYVKVFSAGMRMSIEKFYRTTGLARPTIDRKIRDSKLLNPDESERVMGIARLIGQAKNMVRESGGLDAFDAGRWVGEWLQMPLPALGDKPQGNLWILWTDAPWFLILSRNSNQERTDKLQCPRFGALPLRRLFTRRTTSGGQGSESTGGRWNRKGVPLLYAASAIALSCLETVVHLGGALALPLNRYLVEIKVSENAWMGRFVFDRSENVGWDALPAGLASIGWGTRWANSFASLIAVVPSVIVPEESNFLLNQRHPDASTLQRESTPPDL